MKKKCILFTGIPESDLKTMLECLSARQKCFAKSTFIFNTGDRIETIGIVISGAVHILREDYWGKRKIIARLESGGIFGEAFACAGVENLPVSVMAAEDSEILFLNSARVFKTCSSACVFHARLIKNLVLLMAEKNIALIQKLECITQPSTREKLLSYLSEQAQNAGRSNFTIPFSREELADYLSVERSAMSAELSKMKDDGLLIYKKNSFELLKG